MMDIWQWVTQAGRRLRADGQGRLADLMEALPSAACENAHARVDAMYPEALALARASGNPWVEVFVRHWNLQSRILHRHEVAEWVGEAVSLVEFASRPETRSCPQSVCVTQDLVNCYGNADGPGYAAERIAATEETLARIDASWPCYRCIGGELLEALLDAGEAEKALARIDAMEAAIHRVEGRLESNPMGESRVAILRRLLRYEEALALVEQIEEESYNDEDSRLERQIERAWLLSLLGRADEARGALPAFEALGGTHSLYPAWATVTMRLARQGVVKNDGWLDRRLRRLGAELAQIGAVRHALELVLDRGQLALDRGRRGTAAGCLAEVDRLMPRLRRPLDAAEKRAALAAALAAAPADAVEVGDDAEAVLARLGHDPEADLAVIEAALSRWPGEEALVLRRAAALMALGEGAAAETALRGWLAGQPAAGAAQAMLGRLLVERGAFDEARVIGEALGEAGEAFASAGRALLVQVARARGDRAAAQALLRAEVAASPDDTGAAMALAEMLAEGGERAEALAVLDALAARAGAGPWDVARLVQASVLDRGETVRDAAARLGWVEGGEGEVIRLRFDEADGGEAEVWARRTGPATAKVLTMERPGRPQHFHDVVVFDPRPLAGDEGGAELDDDEDEDGEWADGPPTIYAAVAVKERAGLLVFAVDGVHPGDDELDELYLALEEVGAHPRRMSGGDYRLVDPHTEAERDAVYVYVAVEPGQRGALDGVLSLFAERWGTPLVWPELLEALGARKRLRAQHAVMEAWGI